MKTILALTAVRIRLTLRNKAFLFFTLIMPMTFFFLYGSIFAKGRPEIVKYLLGPIISLTVMGTFWGLSAQLVTWREQGILRRFRLAPISPASMIGSSIISNCIMILPTVVLELLLAHFVYKVQSFGNLTSVMALSLAGIASFASLGLIVASVTNTMQETQVINQLLWFAFLFFSGATFPLLALPKVVQHIALFLPATYLVTGLQKAMVLPANIPGVAIELLTLLAWGALAFTVSSLLFRWEPEAKLPKNAKLWAVATLLPFILLGVFENHYGTLVKTAQTLDTKTEQQHPPQPPPQQ